MKLSIITATYHRPTILKARALPSLLSQSVNPENLEWIVVNDSGNPETTHLIATLDAEFGVVHHLMPHPDTGFGLCHARNTGLAIATGELVAYLDDDNALDPEFANKTIQFFEQHPNIQYSMAQQRRRRDSPRGNGVPFISPSIDCSITALIRHDELFDSNGFAHRRESAPFWNPDYRIFCDYRYFVDCLSQWGPEAFALQPSVLVDYVQSSNGIIGQSHYGEWATELLQICNESIEAIAPHRDHLLSLIQNWRQKGDRSISAFAVD